MIGLTSKEFPGGRVYWDFTKVCTIPQWWTDTQKNITQCLFMHRHDGVDVNRQFCNQTSCFVHFKAHWCQTLSSVQINDIPSRNTWSLLYLDALKCNSIFSKSNQSLALFVVVQTPDHGTSVYLDITRLVRYSYFVPSLYKYDLHSYQRDQNSNSFDPSRFLSRWMIVGPNCWLSTSEIYNVEVRQVFALYSKPLRTWP
jgi:hypothetical protein